MLHRPALLLLPALLLALASPAQALSIVTLALDPAQSALTPEVGGAQSLSGTITIEVGALPLGGANTTFDLVALSATASGGATITLDPSVANPGLGVLTPAGTYFVQTDIRPLGFEDDFEFCRMLPREIGVAAIPTSAFYSDREAGKHLVRFAFCKTDAVLDEGLRRLRKLKER